MGVSRVVAVVLLLAALPQLTNEPAGSFAPADAPDGGPPPLHGAGYVIEEGRPGVVAGYVERPVAVAAIDRGRRSSAPRRVCGWFDYTSEHSFAPAATGALVVGFSYLLACVEAGTAALVFADLRVWDPTEPGGGVVTTTEEVVAFARSLFAFEPPAILSAPPAGAAVVGVAVWLGHPDDVAAPQVRHAQAGPLWASAEAIPISVTYEPGDDRPPLVCSPVPGPPDPMGEAPDCAAVTWLHAGEPTLAATVTYRILVATGDNETGVVSGPEEVDLVVGPAAGLPLAVVELQSVIR